jgi:hypothetical protein
MELRARNRLNLRRAAMMAALGALLAPATAGAAAKAPVITKVSPTSVSVGDTLVITGKNFRRGRATNTVLFKRDGGKALFVKADVSTTKRLTVVIPKQLEKYMSAKSGLPLATRFRLRVLTSRLSKAYTTAKKSPVVGPARPSTGPGGGSNTSTPPLDPNADCDSDGLTNGLEATIGTNPCVADTDGDGVTDGFEYRSAVDLNQDNYRNPTSSLPYPGKRPYPNPLDPSDANTDYDGDWLSLGTEYKLWRYTVVNEHASASLDHMLYSDGLKYSIPGLSATNYDKQAEFQANLLAEGATMVTLPDDGVTRPLLDVNRDGVVSPSETNYYDQNHDGRLSDDERDEDADGLSNVVEDSGQMEPNYWKGLYTRETPFRITYQGTDPFDADSDGDGLIDGADDQDHDDYPNLVELSRAAVSGRGLDSPTTAVGAGNPSPDYGRVNPFNPCLPYPLSRTCPSYIPLSGPVWAPFDTPPWVATGDDPDYLVLN